MLPMYIDPNVKTAWKKSAPFAALGLVAALKFRHLGVRAGALGVATGTLATLGRFSWLRIIGKQGTPRSISVSRGADPEAIQLGEDGVVVPLTDRFLSPLELFTLQRGGRTVVQTPVAFQSSDRLTVNGQNVFGRLCNRSLLAISARGTDDLVRQLREKHDDYSALIVGVHAQGFDESFIGGLQKEGFKVWVYGDRLGLIAVTAARTNPLARFFLGERGYDTCSYMSAQGGAGVQLAGVNEIPFHTRAPEQVGHL
jgi:hypothetical protein